MKTFRPVSLDELVDACAEAPASVLLAGGTDLMVDVNYGRLRPTSMIDLTRVRELRAWHMAEGRLHIGAGVTFAQIEHELVTHAPALATAARTVGSPQIRQCATIGGNIGTASPAGDALPVLVAHSATIELASVRGVRAVPVREYFLAPRQTVREPDECIAAVVLQRSERSAEQFSKIGVRNAMVISVASFALHLDPAAARVGTGMGSVGPTPLAAPGAEQWLAASLFDGAGGVRPPDAQTVQRFSALVAEAASPIDDIRGTARYRRHVLQAMARRTLAWAVAELEVAA